MAQHAAAVRRLELPATFRASALGAVGQRPIGWPESRRVGDGTDLMRPQAGCLRWRYLVYGAVR